MLWFIYLVIYALVVAGWWMIFSKAGEAGWKAIIPIWNILVLLRIVGARLVVDHPHADPDREHRDLGHRLARPREELRSRDGLRDRPFHPLADFRAILGFGSDTYKGPAASGGAQGAAVDPRRCGGPARSSARPHPPAQRRRRHSHCRNAGSLRAGAARARWPSRSSKPVRCGSPTLGRFDSGAAPLSRFWRVDADRGQLEAGQAERDLPLKSAQVRWRAVKTIARLIAIWRIPQAGQASTSRFLTEAPSINFDIEVIQPLLELRVVSS